MSAASRKKPHRKSRSGKNAAITGLAGHAGGQLAREGFAQRIVSSQTQAFQEALTPSRDLRSLLEHMRRCYEEYDARMAQTPFSPPFACARGCSHCCFNQISLTPPEAVYLGVHLLERWDAERLQQLQLHTLELVRKIAGKGLQEVAAIRQELPCVLLEDGACSVHQARPFACRGWNSVNVEQCRQSVTMRDPMALIENHPLPRELAEALQQGLLAGAQTLNMEAGFLMLPRALHLLLEHGALECGQTWLQGGEFFRKWRNVVV